MTLETRRNDEDEFIQRMVAKMIMKFDKYWKECNLLMGVAAILDPRQKMKGVEFSFAKIYSSLEAQKHLIKVKKEIFDLFEEYVNMNPTSEGASLVSSSSHNVLIREPSLYWDSLDEQELSDASGQPQRSELTDYLDQPRLRPTSDPKNFDCLEWWKMNETSFPVLSRMAADILAIPITTVASEATFSSGTRVIDSYRASLVPETVQMLLYAGDWCRHFCGVKKKMKVSFKFLTSQYKYYL